MNWRNGVTAVVGHRVYPAPDEPIGLSCGHCGRGIVYWPLSSVVAEALALAESGER